MQDTRAACGGGSSKVSEQGAVTGYDRVQLLLLRDVRDPVLCDETWTSTQSSWLYPRSWEQGREGWRDGKICTAAGVRLLRAVEVDEDFHVSGREGRRERRKWGGWKEGRNGT